MTQFTTNNNKLEALIGTRNLSFSLDDHSILSEISLTLHPGELVGLIGPNGAGKTTLLKALGGLLPPTVGDITLLDRPLATYRPREVAQIIAHVPQSTSVGFAFTVREVALMGRSPYLGRFGIETTADRQIAEVALDKMNVLHLADRFINTLSGGEQQRVFIARALTQRPKILLLDEPTANLDIGHQLDLLEMARTQAHDEGLGIIAAIHDLNHASQFCDRLALLHQGRVVVDDVPDVVLTPDHLARTFGVLAHAYRDPVNDALRLSFARNGHHVIADERLSTENTEITE